MTNYEQELNYHLDLLYSLGGQWEAEELAEQLIEYGKLQANGMLTDSQNRLGLIRELVLRVESDPWRLQRFREVYVVWIVSMPDSERTRVADAVRELCKAEFPSLTKKLGLQLQEIKETIARYEKMLSC